MKIKICYIGEDITAVNRAHVAGEQVIELPHSECGWAIDKPHQYKVVNGKLLKRDQQEISAIELQTEADGLREKVIAAIEKEAARRVAAVGQFATTGQALQQLMEAVDILNKKIDNQATAEELVQLDIFKTRKNETKRLRKKEESLKAWIQDATIEELNNFVPDNDENWS